MQFFLFFIIAFIVLSLLYGYSTWRIITPLDLDAPWGGIIFTIIFISMILVPAVMIMRTSGYSNTFTDIISWIAYVILGFFILLFFLIFVRDMIFFIYTSIQKLYEVFSSTTGKEIVNSERRFFLLKISNFGFLGLSAILTGYGAYIARRLPRIEKIKIPIPDLPDEFDGFRIVQITDLHIGPTIKRNFVKTIVEQANRCAPDLVVFTGDLADGPVLSLREDAKPLSQLHASHGLFFVTGNHEYYSGIFDWLSELQRLGFTVLNNKHVLLKKGNAGVILAGVTDPEGGKFIKEHISNPVKAMEGAPDLPVKILLSHRPRSIFKSAEMGFSLQISGHTHGGQFIPWNQFVKLAEPYICGLHKHNDTYIYVSRGTGYWGPPLRVGVPSEITEITLVKNIRS